MAKQKQEKQEQEWISEDILLDQIEFLNPPGGRPSPFKLMDSSRKRAFSRKPRGVGGRGKKREWWVLIAPEYVANTYLQRASGETIERIAAVVQGTSMLERCVYAGPKHVIAFAQSVSRAAQGADREEVAAIAPLMVVWLRQKRKATRLLYQQPEEEKIMDEFFESQDFSRLVFSITNNLFEGYRYEGNRLVTPAGSKIAPEAAALKTFPKLSVNEAPTSMVAKPRD